MAAALAFRFCSCDRSMPAARLCSLRAIDARRRGSAPATAVDRWPARFCACARSARGAILHLRRSMLAARSGLRGRRCARSCSWPRSTRLRGRARRRRCRVAAAAGCGRCRAARRGRGSARPRDWRVPRARDRAAVSRPRNSSRARASPTAAAADRALPHRDRARRGDCRTSCRQLTSRSRESIRRLTLMVFQRLTLMLTSRRRQSTPPHSEFDTPMPTPHQNPAWTALLQPQPQRGGGGKKNGGNAGCHHGPNAQTRVEDGHEDDLRVGRDDGDDLRGRRRRVHHDRSAAAAARARSRRPAARWMRGCPRPSPSRAGTAPNPSRRRAARETRRPGRAPIADSHRASRAPAGTPPATARLDPTACPAPPPPPRRPRSWRCA